MTFGTIVRASLMAVAILASAPSLAQPVVNDWVLAQWRGEAYYYPAIVTAVKGASVSLAYDDGTRETRPVNQVKPYDWTLGSKIECRWSDGKWYSASISAMGADGLTLDVLYDDGDRQRTNTGRCRSL